MTTDRLAYYAASAAAAALDAQAWQARARADRLCPHDSADLRERNAQHALRLADYYFESAEYWLALARGEDPDAPQRPQDSSAPGTSPGPTNAEAQ